MSVVIILNELFFINVSVIIIVCILYIVEPCLSKEYPLLGKLIFVQLITFRNQTKADEEKKKKERQLEQMEGRERGRTLSQCSGWIRILKFTSIRIRVQAFSRPSSNNSMGIEKTRIQ